MNLYDNIEEPIRDTVRLLRDNGFNTTGSCGHEMWIELDLGNTLSEAENIATLLLENDMDDFRIDACIHSNCGGLFIRRARVQFGVLGSMSREQKNDGKVGF